MKWAAWLLIAAAFTSSWSAVHVAGFQLVDYLLVASLLVLGVQSLSHNATIEFPAFCWALPVAIVVILVEHVAFPTSSSFLFNRFTLNGPQVVSDSADVLRGFKWVEAVVLVPLLIASIGKSRPQTVRLVMLSAMFGAALSSLVAVSDYAGLTSISAKLIVADNGGRQAGLTSQANLVGVASAIIVPVALYGMSQRRIRVWSLLALGTLAGGTLVSGSRGAQAVFALVLIATVVLTPSGRRAGPFAIIGTAIAAYLALTSTSFTSGKANIFRISNSAITNQSDSARAGLGHQALLDFAHNPFFGIGLDQLTAAHRIYYQMLASGGLMLIIAFAWYLGGAVKALLRVGSGEPLARIALLTIFSWLVVGIVENNLTDRFLYIPVGVGAYFATVYIGPLSPGARRRLVRARQIERPTARPGSGRRGVRGGREHARAR